TGTPGTTVTALMQPDKAINVSEAEAYIREFVAFLPIEVWLNGKKVSGRPIGESVPALQKTWSVTKSRADLGEGLKADVDLTGTINGDVWIELRNIQYGSEKLEGRMVLRQGAVNLRTSRSGFGLATVSVSSVYQLGG